ncbi:MAG: response regulator [Dehalococcoidia bacterium]
MADKVLIVEDDPAALRLVSYILESAGYEVVSATNGLEALQKAVEDSPSLVVLDVMLPGIDGFEVCHRLRAIVASHVPILMLSAKAQAADRQTGERVGADLYLVKPATPEEITSAVRQLLDWQQAA